MRKKLLLIASCLITFLAITQEATFLDSIKLNLTSDEFNAKGYTESRSNSLATFLSSEYSKLGLKSLEGNEMISRINISYNEILKSELILDNNHLRSGVDFITSNESRSALGLHEVVLITADVMTDPKLQKELLTESYRNKIVAFDTRTHALLQNLPAQYYKHVRQASAFIELVDELASTELSMKQAINPHFFVKKSVVGKKMKKAQFDVKAKIVDGTSFNLAATLPDYDSTRSTVVISTHSDKWLKESAELGVNTHDIAIQLDLAKRLIDMNEHNVNYVFVALGAEELNNISFQTFENEFDLGDIKYVLSIDQLMDFTNLKVVSTRKNTAAIEDLKTIWGENDLSVVRNAPNNILSSWKHSEVIDVQLYSTSKESEFDRSSYSANSDLLIKFLTQ